MMQDFVLPEGQSGIIHYCGNVKLNFIQLKALLIISGFIEGVTGIALAVLPSFTISLLLGSSLTDPSSVLIARLAGVALFTIGTACLLSNSLPEFSFMIKAMSVYNFFATMLLVYAVSVEKISGPGLWPAVLVHFSLLVWCISLWLGRAHKTSVPFETRMAPDKV